MITIPVIGGRGPEVINADQGERGNLMAPKTQENDEPIQPDAEPTTKDRAEKAAEKSEASD